MVIGSEIPPDSAGRPGRPARPGRLDLLALRELTVQTEPMEPPAQLVPLALQEPTELAERLAQRERLVHQAPWTWAMVTPLEELKLCSASPVAPKTRQWVSKHSIATRLAAGRFRWIISIKATLPTVTKRFLAILPAAAT